MPTPARAAAAARSSLMVCLLLGAAVACDRESPTAPPPPAPFDVEPLDPEGGPLPDPLLPVPTWTMPSSVVAPPLGSPPVPPAAVATSIAPPGIPVPTAMAPLPVPPDGPPAVDPEIVALLGDVQGARLALDVQRLAGFGTRHPLSPADDPRRGVGAARAWLAEQFTRLGGASADRQVQVEFEDFALDFAGRATTQRNVIATLPGIGRSKRLIYLTAHYDSRTEDVTNGTADAPGADDDASGVAALIELARVMRRRQWDATLRFVAFAAEEPGQKGSRHHAPAAARVKLPIVAVLNSDIVGGSVGAGGEVDRDRVRAFSADPDDGPSRRLARYARLVGARYAGAVGLEVVVVPQADRADRGGDHQPFSEAGFAAIRLIEAAEDMSRQHNARDTVDRIDADYLVKVTRLNLVLAANLALAPPAPAAAPRLEVAADRPGELRVSWDPVADPRVAGYWLATRAAGEPAYRPPVWVGGVATTAHTLEGLAAGERIAVAVAAADDRGHMSLFGPEAFR